MLRRWPGQCVAWRHAGWLPSHLHGSVSRLSCRCGQTPEPTRSALPYPAPLRWLCGRRQNEMLAPLFRCHHKTRATSLRGEPSSASTHPVTLRATTATANECCWLRRSDRVQADGLLPAHRSRSSRSDPAPCEARQTAPGPSTVAPTSCRAGRGWECPARRALP